MLRTWRCFLLEESEILIWDPCWQLFQRGVNNTRANSPLMGAPLVSMGLSWGWFYCYFGGELCAFSFFLLLLVFFLGVVVGRCSLGDLVFWLLSPLAAKQVPAAKGVCVCRSPCCKSLWPGWNTTQLLSARTVGMGKGVCSPSVSLSISQPCRLLTQKKWSESLICPLFPAHLVLCCFSISRSDFNILILISLILISLYREMLEVTVAWGTIYQQLQAQQGTGAEQVDPSLLSFQTKVFLELG